jgi:hypothetical protein
MIRPTIRTSLRVFAGIVAAFAILVAAGVWRLSQGPVSFAFLVPVIEDAVNDPDLPFRLEFDDAILLWDESTRRVGIRFVDARAFDLAGSELARVPQLSLSLSTRALARGRIAAREVAIYRPVIRARLEDGGLLVSGEEGSSYGAHLDEALRDLPAHLASGDLQYLDAIEVIDADLTIVGNPKNPPWRGHIGEAQLWRRPDAFRWTIAVDAADGDFLRLSISGDYRPAAQTVELAATFAALRPATVARLSDRWQLLAGFDLPLAGTARVAYQGTDAQITVALEVRGESGHLEIPPVLAERWGIPSWTQRLAVDALELRGRYEGADGLLEIERFHLAPAANSIFRLAAPLNTEVPVAAIDARGRYTIGGERIDIEELAIDLGEGATIRLPAPVDHLLPVRSLRGKGRYLGADRRFAFAPVEIDLQGPRAVLSAITVDHGPRVRARIQGSLHDVPVDDLPRYWPGSLVPGGFAWVASHLSEGSVPLTEFAIEIAADGEGRVAVEMVSGSMTISAVTVDYLPPLPKVVGVNATAAFAADRFSVAVTSGEAAGVTVREATVELTGLNSAEEIATIAVAVDGPVPAVLALIDHQPLNYARTSDFAPEQTAGHASVALNLRFPLIAALDLGAIEVSATADLTDLEIAGALFGRNLRRGQLALRFDKEGVEAEGRISLESIEGFIIGRQNFRSDAPFRRRIEADLRDAKVAQVQEILFGRTVVPKAMLDGAIDAVIRFTEQPKVDAEFQVDVDLAKATIETPALGWSKTAGAATKAELTGRIDGKQLVSFPRVAVSGEGLSLTGAAKLRSRGRLDRIDVQRVVAGRTDVGGAYVVEPDGRVTVTVQGASLDLVPFRRQLARGFFDEQAEASDRERVSVTVDVATVWLAPTRRLTAVSGSLASEGVVLRTADLHARNESGGGIDLTVRRDNHGRRLATAQSDNAGSTLRTLGVFDNIEGGKLEFSGTFPTDRSGASSNGVLMVTDYRVSKAPTVARVLSAIAITGFADAMSGDGLAFSRLEIPFSFADGVIEITKAKATGLSLGFTAAGTLNLDEEQIELEGTVVPMYALNSALGRIPLVGGAFTGGEEGGGLFAANYRLNGSFDDPKVSVNPLSALAPSFLRELFSASDPKPRDPNLPEVPMDRDGRP